MKENRKDLNRDVIAHSEYSSYADFVLAQAIHESDNFSSNVYKKNNNPFGMKVPSKRPFLGRVGTKAPDGGHYAAYDNDMIAFKDYLKWLRYTNFPIGLKTVEEFVAAMKKRGYFGASEESYLKAMKVRLSKL